MVICFLSDFGLQDDFVGTCHGVIARIAPDARVIDVTHGIPATAVLQGAHVLASTLPYMPVGVHLAVVDPGVGGVRRPVALADRDGHLFVGPDNGLLLPAAERAGIADRAARTEAERSPEALLACSRCRNQDRRAGLRISPNTASCSRSACSRRPSLQPWAATPRHRRA